MDQQERTYLRLKIQSLEAEYASNLEAVIQLERQQKELSKRIWKERQDCAWQALFIDELKEKLASDA